ncbi:MAG: HAD hydrolase-like protein [bacterium]|nr:HAD hydrolase-like protein [bacterium]
MIPKKIQEMNADLWVFDNDGTLYDNPMELEIVVGKRMNEYIASHYCISKEDAKEKRRELFKKHNTKYTLIALRQEGISEDDFIKKTYLSINPIDFNIRPSMELKELIGSLAGEKIVLTNNPSEFAGLILEALGIKHLFSQIIGMRERNYVQKPEIDAFKFLNHWLKNDKIVVVIDDCLDNIKIAESLGCITLCAKVDT